MFSPILKYKNIFKTDSITSSYFDFAFFLNNRGGKQRNLVMTQLPLYFLLNLYWEQGHNANKRIILKRHNSCIKKKIHYLFLKKEDLEVGVGINMGYIRKYTNAHSLILCSRSCRRYLNVSDPAVLWLWESETQVCA